MNTEQVEAWRQNIRNTTFAGYHYEMGVALLAAGERKAAAAAFERALEIQENHHAARFLLEGLLGAMGLPDAAARIAAAGRAIDPAYRIKGAERRLVSLLEDQKFDQAHDIMENLSREELSNPIFNVFKAIFLIHENKSEEANALLSHLPEKRLSDNGDFVLPLKFAAEKLYFFKPFSQVILLLDLILSITPDDQDTLLKRAGCALAFADYRKALALLDDPGTFKSATVAHYYRSIAFLELGETREARQELHLVDQIKPGHGVTLAFQALIALADGQEADARSAIDLAQQKLDSDPWVQLASAATLLVQGHDNAADQAIRNAMAMHGEKFSLRLSWLSRSAESLRNRLTALGYPLPTEA